LDTRFFEDPVDDFFGINMRVDAPDLDFTESLFQESPTENAAGWRFLFGCDIAGKYCGANTKLEDIISDAPNLTCV
jgi:hypothetical protein